MELSLSIKPLRLVQYESIGFLPQKERERENAHAKYNKEITVEFVH
jgi:hypothetical protein